AFFETGAAGSPSGDGARRAPGAPVAAPDPGEAAARRDRVVARLLDEALVSMRHVREALNQWRRTGERDALWRWVAAHPDVNAEAVFALVARTYAFAPADLDGGLDAQFVKRVVGSFSAEQRDRLLALNLLPLAHHIEPGRGVKLVFAAQDPTSPDFLRLLHD